MDLLQDLGNLKDAQEYGMIKKLFLVLKIMFIQYRHSSSFLIFFPLPSDKFYLQYINHVSQELENLRNSIIQYIQVRELVLLFYCKIDRMILNHFRIMSCKAI